MTLGEFKDLAGGLQSIATIASFMIGGTWAYQKFIRQQEKYPNIEFLADINIIGNQGDYWIAELIATIDNKGKAQHKMESLNFDLNAIFQTDDIKLEAKWGNQVNFPRTIAEGSFSPEQYKYFFIDPGTKAKYSYITRIPKEASFLIFHT